MINISQKSWHFSIGYLLINIVQKSIRKIKNKNSNHFFWIRLQYVKKHAKIYCTFLEDIKPKGIFPWEPFNNGTLNQNKMMYTRMQKKLIFQLSLWASCNLFHVSKGSAHCFSSVADKKVKIFYLLFKQMMNESTGLSGKPTNQGLQDRTFLTHCVHLYIWKSQKKGKTIELPRKVRLTPEYSVFEWTVCLHQEKSWNH